MEPQVSEKPTKASDNPEKLRAVTLALARTPVKFGDRGVIEMYLRMAVNALDQTKGANEIKDTWSKAYDELLAKIEKDAKDRRGYR
jgi:hypothetical protein